MATSISEHVSDFVLRQNDSKAENIARALYEKSVTLVQVIECLGEYLTSHNVEQRKRGTRLLADILQKLPSDFLVEVEVGHVTGFLLSKLSDHHSIQPIALHGLAAVTNFAGFCDASLSRQVCTEIFKEVQNQTLSQGDRRSTFTIFHNLLNLHLADLLPMGDNFVCGYVQQMDGEKDPRNLMLAFRCSLLVCHHFPLGAMEEDMFEVNSCYFPVDFVPPPNDPHGITREDLSEALCRVMSATPHFAKYCYPLLLEKLTSDVASAKLDALKTLSACLAVFETEDLPQYLGSLSTQLIREVRAGSSEELVSASLQALTAMTAQLSKWLKMLQVPSEFEEFMAETGANLVHQVESENLAARLSAVRVLCAMATASGKMCHAVASRLVPAVCGVCQNLSQLEQHTEFFTEVSSLLEHVADAQSKINDWSILQDWRARLQETCDKLLASKDPQLHVLGMRGLLALMTWGAVFTAEEIASGVENMTNRALSADSDSFRQEGRKAVSRVVQHHTHLSEKVMSQISDALRNNLPHYHNSSSKEAVENSASLLVAVGVDSRTAEKVCQVLIGFLQSYHTGKEDSMLPISNSLSQVLATGHLLADFLISSSFPNILHFLWPGCASWPDEKAQVHALVLSHLADGVRSATLQLELQASQEIVSYICNVIMNANSGGEQTGDRSPLKATSPWQLTRLVQVLLSIIPCWDTKADSLVESPLSQLPDVALKVEDRHTHLQACRCLAAIVNKMPSGPQLESTVKELCKHLTSELTQCAVPDSQERALNLLAWLTKAMVVRGHRLSAEMTQQLRGLLSDHKLGVRAAEGFHVIMTPFSDVLCASVRAIVSPTFQQRFLLQSLPSLLDGFQGSQSELKENYLLAVAGMLTHIPQQVLVNELPQLMPILASSLKGCNSRLHMEALRALTAGLKYTPELLTSYLSDILPHCLTLATAGNHMCVRILAIKCVGEMIHLPAMATQPHKAAVIKSLKTAIDDPKRLVRKEAVLARSVWFLL